MWRFVLLGFLLVALGAVGCGNGTPRGGADTTRPTPTETRTVTKKPRPTEEPPATVTKPPPRTVTKTPPEGIAPQGQAEGCLYTLSQPEISTGSSGAAVKKAQCYLNLSLTGEDLPEDGQFGPVTDAATKRFQGCAGITVDGLIGPETWSQLVLWASAPPVC